MYSDLYREQRNQSKYNDARRHSLYALPDIFHLVREVNN